MRTGEAPGYGQQWKLSPTVWFPEIRYLENQQSL
jgi:hypothetical protein